MDWHLFKICYYTWFFYFVVGFVICFFEESWVICHVNFSSSLIAPYNDIWHIPFTLGLLFWENCDPGGLMCFHQEVHYSILTFFVSSIFIDLCDHYLRTIFPCIVYSTRAETFPILCLIEYLSLIMCSVYP